MRKQSLSTSIIAMTCSLALAPLVPLAQAAPPAIEVLETFDYPAAVTSTVAQDINENGDVAGAYFNAFGVERGFVRMRDGSFSASIVPSFAAGGTGANGLNDARTVGGFFYDADGITFHGYFLSGGIYSQFDVPGAIWTDVSAINTAADFVGSFFNEAQRGSAYLDAAGSITVFNIPGATSTFASNINALRQITGIYYNVEDGYSHGFLVDELGNLIFPIDFPDALQTFPRGLNDRGLIVGAYYDARFKEHGFLLKRPNTFLRFDYPRSPDTILTGINNKGLLCGSYVDYSGYHHGFIARLTH